MRTGCIIAAVAAGCLAACAPPVSGPARDEGGGRPDFPQRPTSRPRAAESPVYEVDPVNSRVVIEVRRGGALAQLGHDHVVVAHDVVGYVAPSEGRADLYLRLDRLVVDEPAERAQARFDGQPPDDAIAGTRTNMLRKLGADGTIRTPSSACAAWAAMPQARGSMPTIARQRRRSRAAHSGEIAVAAGGSHRRPAR